MVIHYRVPEPFGDKIIEAYTDHNSNEWRLVDGEGTTLYDTALAEGGAGMGYGCPELALRQALIAVYADPHMDAEEPGWLADTE